MAEERFEYDTGRGSLVARVLVVDGRVGLWAELLAASVSALAYTGFDAIVLDASDGKAGGWQDVETVLANSAGRTCPVAFQVADATDPALMAMLGRLAAVGVVVWRFSARQPAMDFARREGQLWAASGLRPSPLRSFREPAASERKPAPEVGPIPERRTGLQA